MSKLFGVLTSNVLVEEVLPKDTKKANNQRTLLNGAIVRIERTLPDGNYIVRCLKADRDSWETNQFNCPKNKCYLVPEELYQFLAAVESPLERVKVATNKERHEKLLLITVDMVVAYTDEDNILLGMVKYIGKVPSIGLCYGIQLREKKQGTRCNGSIARVQYFNCLPGYGIFATIDRLVAHNVLHNNLPGSGTDDNGKYSPTNKCLTNSIKKPTYKSQTTYTDKNTTSVITSSSQQDELPDNARNMKSSRSFQQPLSNENKRESVNTNNDFDHNTILQSDRLQLLTNKGTKQSAALRNSEDNEKSGKINDSKLTNVEPFSNTAEIINAFTQPDTKTIRNKSLNIISHLNSSSKGISKKRKEATFKSYDLGKFKVG